VARHWGRASPLRCEHHSTSLLNILELYRHFECTDPRDRIYALLGLPSIDRNIPLPQPDYSKSVSEVYCETVKAIIQHTADLSILCVPRDLRGVHSEHNLPSWVPNWTDKPSETAGLIQTGPPHLFRAECAFAAAKETFPKGPDFDFQREITSFGFVPKKARLIASSRRFWLKAGDGMGPSGLIERPIAPSCPPGSNHRLLELSGYIVDEIRLISSPIPEESFSGDGWKTHILIWDRMVARILIILQHEGGDSDVAFDLLASFLGVIMRGQFHQTRGRELSDEHLTLSHIYHYLVWSGQIRRERAPCTIDERTLGFIFDIILKESVRGRKFALTNRGIPALVPESASEGDKIAIVFGCDLPLVVRRLDTTTTPYDTESGRCWLLLGCTYVDGMMRGEGLEEAQERGLEEQRFLFF